jgi:integrase
MSQSRRLKGTGGLWQRTTTRLNPRTGELETIQVWQAAKEVPHPTEETKRKWVTGTGSTPTEASKKLSKNLERHFKKLAIPQPASAAIRHGGQTLQNYLEEWVRELDPNRVSPQLQRKYGQYLRNHVIPHLGSIPIKDLSYQHLKNLFDVTLPAKTKLASSDQLLGTNARLNIYKVLSNALKVAVKKGTIDRNPLELVTPPRYKQPDENIPQMMHIAKWLFGKLEKENLEAYDHFLLGIMGLRRGERLGLSFSDLSLSGQTPKMTIRKQLSWITGEGLVIKPTTKTGKPRTVFLSEPWLSSLKRMKDKRREQKKLDSFAPKPEFEDLVFLKDNGKPFSLNEDNSYWNTLQDQAQMKNKLRGHSLRHIAATSMADNGVDVEVAMEILGHESTAMSFYYRRTTARKQSSQVTNYGLGWSRNTT